jgi:hypothetical protein
VRAADSATRVMGDYGMEKFAARFIPHAYRHAFAMSQSSKAWLQFASELILSRYRSTGGDTVTGLSLLRSVKRADGKFWNVSTTTHPNVSPDNSSFAFDEGREDRRAVRSPLIKNVAACAH